MLLHALCALLIEPITTAKARRKPQTQQVARKETKLCSEERMCIFKVRLSGINEVPSRGMLFCKIVTPFL